MIVLIFEVGERLMLFEEVMDDNFGESGVWIVDILSVEHAPHYVNPGFSELVIACGLPKETFVDNCCRSSLWLTHVIHIHVGVLVKWTFVAKNLSKDFGIDSALLVGQKEFIRICALDLLDCVPELLHKDFEDICRDSESLEARGVLDYINDHLKCLFLLWHSGFQSQIGRAYLDSISRWNSFFITSNDLLRFLLIHDSA
ncbi:hypothetical protein Tco_0500776 [Tanacetum coccineum]